MLLQILSYAEIDWWKRTIRVWELRNDTQRDEDGFEVGLSYNSQAR